jgi:hypothetical protein
MDAWGLYYKPLQIRILQQIDRFRIKLVPSGSDEHTSLLQSLYISNP